MRALFFTFVMLLIAILSLLGTPQAGPTSTSAAGEVIVDTRLERVQDSASSVYTFPAPSTARPVTLGAGLEVVASMGAGAATR